MKVDTDDLKTRVSFKELVTQTHTPDRAGKIPCPHHDDRNPSYHVYDDHGYCFVCQKQDDHVSWLQVRDGLSFRAALAELEALAGVSSSLPTPVRRRPAPKPQDRPCDARPITLGQQELQWRRAARLTAVPEALKGRGFTLGDMLQLGVASEHGDALLPITSPEGTVIAIKRRRAVPEPHRYEYLTPGHGAPAWCSPSFLQQAEVLIVEGELNGMACWLARPELAVMGAAGAGGSLHLSALRGRTVVIYADGDRVGLEARARWAHQAHRAGAEKIYLLPAWDDGDACDLAGRDGRAALRERIT